MCGRARRGLMSAASTLHLRLALGIGRRAAHSGTRQSHGAGMQSHLGVPCRRSKVKRWCREALGAPQRFAKRSSEAIWSPGETRAASWPLLDAEARICGAESKAASGRGGAVIRQLLQHGVRALSWPARRPLSATGGPGSGATAEAAAAHQWDFVGVVGISQRAGRNRGARWTAAWIRRSQRLCHQPAQAASPRACRAFLHRARPCQEQTAVMAPRPSLL